MRDQFRKLRGLLTELRSALRRLVVLWLRKYGGTFIAEKGVKENKRAVLLNFKPFLFIPLPSYLYFSFSNCEFMNVNWKTDQFTSRTARVRSGFQLFTCPSIHPTNQLISRVPLHAAWLAC